jgi:bifunctional ADP-heptose synthase (sugar kinase/adenylyltransferase)
MEIADGLVEAFIDQAARLRVCVVGETIVDEFVEVRYEGQSMKSFCPVFSYANPPGDVITQMGGAAAVANHLCDFVREVVLVSNAPDEIVKTRLIDKDDGKKHVEINRFDLKSKAPQYVGDHFDVVIIADFGHGFCDSLQPTGRYHYMTQTNSNNFGYNRMSKWKAYPKKSACLDLREASLQVNRRTDFSEKNMLRELYNYEIGADKLFLTLGKRGSVYYDGLNYVKQPAFKGQVVDTIGAGDTFFAFAALASEMRWDDVNHIMVVPALAASLSCTWLCNEQEVTRQKLRTYATRHIQALL